MYSNLYITVPNAIANLSQESYFTYGEDGQSPVDHDVHFRPGLGADGTETYMPRTVIYDLKGGFGSMRKINALYEAEGGEPTALWYVSRFRGWEICY